MWNEGAVVDKMIHYILIVKKKGKRKVQGVPQSQTAALPRPQEEIQTSTNRTNVRKQAQIEQTYETI